jgi:hypothetical protein
MNDQHKEEGTHSFDVADVNKYGSIEKALIMKELRGMQLYKQRNGKPDWVYYSAAALESKFPYMQKSSIKRWMKELIKAGHLEAISKNKSKYDRTLSYRLADIVPSTVQNGPSLGQTEPTIPSHTTPLSKAPSGAVEINAQMRQVYDHFVVVFDRNPNTYKLTDKRKQKLRARLRDAGYEMLTAAIDHVGSEPFYRGDNDRGWQADLDFIIRSYEQVERFGTRRSSEKSITLEGSAV